MKNYKTLNLYQQKKYWKLGLAILAVGIITLSLWYTNIIVSKISNSERQNIQTWADAIRQRALLVKTTGTFFKKLQEEERKKVEIFSEASRRFVDNPLDISFYLKVMQSNTTIPVLLTDNNDSILIMNNIELPPDVHFLTGELKNEFSRNKPIIFDFLKGTIVDKGSKTTQTYYYKDSKLFTDLKNYMDELTTSFFEEVLGNAVSVPVIITDSTQTIIIDYSNIKENINDSVDQQHLIKKMLNANTPVKFELPDRGVQYILYEESYLLQQLRYYPYIQFLVIGLFLLIAYFFFSSARKSEQNRVWVGMAKETAHQLGTPLSSLMAWVEMLRIQEVDETTVEEIEKDVLRLNTVTDRFSKIGSIALLENQNIVKLIYSSVAYLRKRTSRKVKYSISFPEDQTINIPLNQSLFEWVIENLCKNAVDAMGGNGKIDIHIKEDDSSVYLDISDTGKGISRRNFKSVFKPGYTNKKRGWGLGLSLSQRIVEEYHKGKIFVKDSVIGKGTTFRIILPKK